MLPPAESQFVFCCIVGSRRFSTSRSFVRGKGSLVGMLPKALTALVLSDLEASTRSRRECVFRVLFPAIVGLGAVAL